MLLSSKPHARGCDLLLLPPSQCSRTNKGSERQLWRTRPHLTHSVGVDARAVEEPEPLHGLGVFRQLLQFLSVAAVAPVGAGRKNKRKKKTPPVRARLGPSSLATGSMISAARQRVHHGIGNGNIGKHCLQRSRSRSALGARCRQTPPPPPPQPTHAQLLTLEV